MNRTLFLVVLTVTFIGVTVFAADLPSPSSEVQKLEVSAGRWVYHGATLNTPFAKAGKWTWNEDCGWSANRIFMVCSFSNVWFGKAIESLVVDTYNERDKSFWHYELFNGGDSGAKPFISKMTINGNTRIEYAESVERGKKTRTRITYVFDSPTHVRVKIEVSRDGASWVMVDEGVGIKQM